MAPGPPSVECSMMTDTGEDFFLLPVLLGPLPCCCVRPSPLDPFSPLLLLEDEDSFLLLPLLLASSSVPILLHRSARQRVSSSLMSMCSCEVTVWPPRWLSDRREDRLPSPALLHVPPLEDPLLCSDDEDEVWAERAGDCGGLPPSPFPPLLRWVLLSSRGRVRTSLGCSCSCSCCPNAEGRDSAPSTTHSISPSPTLRLARRSERILSISSSVKYRPSTSVWDVRGRFRTDVTGG
mmetsp:Transcript_55715/g.166951  ORF Transcript_55715/g.166951 Transcript_55715/m.166951 type:complete len:236 (+) Transcript_55715:150-857(+)